MPVLIPQPTRIQAAGNKPKIIDEYVGRVNSQTAALSLAHMRSPGGWLEPGQTPEFDEYTVVLRGCLRVESEHGAQVLDVRAGQAVWTRAGEWVRYSTPDADGAEYIAVCLPAFSPAPSTATNSLLWVHQLEVVMKRESRFPILATCIGLGSLLTLLPACAPSADEELAESEQELQTMGDELGAPAAAYSNSTYFIVTRPDLRRCAYPYCGGLFSKRVNQATTTCSDGTAQPECRILEFDYSALGLDTSTLDTLKMDVSMGRALLHGRIVKTGPIVGRTFDKLVVDEAWQARSNAPAPTPSPTLPTGTHARVRELPVACPACPPYRHEVLNSMAVGKPVARINYDTTRFSASVIKELTTALPASAVGLLMAGTLSGASSSTSLAVSEAYTRVKGKPGGRLGDSCGSRGMPTCNAPLFCKWEPSANCGRSDASGVCSKKPDACIALYKPVCGCDRKTYGNSCEANHAGVSVDYEGVCR